MAGTSKVAMGSAMGAPFGWGGAAGTYMFIDPKEDLVWVCFSQVFGHQAMIDNTYLEDFERLVYQALL